MTRASASGPLFGTREDVILLASTGTGAMEAAVINLLAPGEHAIFVNGGKFGERWGKRCSRPSAWCRTRSKSNGAAPCAANRSRTRSS